MIDNVPVINGTMEFKGYSHIEQRVFNFNDYEVIGVDASSNYNIYAIHLGNKEKPKILVIASIHGSEWKSTHYTLDFFEMLYNNTYPDQDFRNYTLQNYHIIYVPVANPYGFDIPYEVPPNTPGSAPRKDGRENYNGVDLNRDFGEQSQPETRAIVNLGNEYKPFAFLSCHLISKKPPSLEVHTADRRLDDIKKLFMDSWSRFSGEEVLDHRHPGFENPTIDYPYFSSLENDYTPYTLSFLTEIGQWEIAHQGNSLEDIYFYGMGSLYIYFKTADIFFKQFNEDANDNGMYVFRIEQPHKTTLFERDINRRVVKVIEEYKNGIIITTEINRE